MTINSINQLNITDNSEVSGYVVNLSPRGFLLISADTDIEPIIAY